MPRIIGIDIPDKKRMEVALTYIYGVGPAIAQRILEDTGISPDKRAKELNDQEISAITRLIQEKYPVEGDLRRQQTGNIKRLMTIGCYRGMRHKRSLPCRGQKTKNNSRTCKGAKRTVGAFKDKGARAALKAQK
jgi:small subunit ribosomal protein S13